MADNSEDSSGSFLRDKKIKVVFVLGGPGSGKGTQCAKIAEHFGFTHLSAGDLLRKETESVSEDSAMIQRMMKEGKIIPAQLTVKLLQRAMLESGNDKFLLDGFPRDEDNRVAFEKLTKREPDFVLFFDCPEEELERRILNRNQGREDDNTETMRKRFKVFYESTIPVVKYYDMKGKVRKVDARKPIDEVFEDVKPIFSPFCSKENWSRSIWTLIGLGYAISTIIRCFLDLHTNGLCRTDRRMIAKILAKICFWK